jgi:uncharacterized protein with PIN domain
MAKQIRLKCMSCEESFFIRDEEVEDSVPEGVVPGEAFTAHCPFCRRMSHVALVE